MARVDRQGVSSTGPAARQDPGGGGLHDTLALRAVAPASRHLQSGRGGPPATIGKSAGIVVESTSGTGAAEVLGTPIRGSAEQIADALRAFGARGFTQLEVLLWPRSPAALEAMAPVIELLDGV